MLYLYILILYINIYICYSEEIDINTNSNTRTRTRTKPIVAKKYYECNAITSKCLLIDTTKIDLDLDVNIELDRINNNNNNDKNNDNDKIMNQYLYENKYMSQDTCLMICNNGILWPYPTGEIALDQEFLLLEQIKVKDSSIGTGTGSIIDSSIDMGLDFEYILNGETITKHSDNKNDNDNNNDNNNKVKSMFGSMSDSFEFIIDNMNSKRSSNGNSGYRYSNSKSDSDLDSVTKSNTNTNPILIVINIMNTTVTAMQLGVDESYHLDIHTNSDGSDSNSGISITIDCNTIFGCRHGLETLSQLIAYDILYHSYTIASSVSIDDRPQFVYRGVMVDTARSFIAMSKLYKIIDGMVGGCVYV